MKRRYLLGVTNYNSLVFADVEIRKDMFTVCFDVNSPLLLDDNTIDSLVDARLSDMDYTDLYNLCEGFDCRPSELADTFRDNAEIVDLIDNSLYPEEFEINGDALVFESESCGQCGEYLKEIINYTYNKDLAEKIERLWTKYHLKKISLDEKVKIEEYFNRVAEIDEYSWVENWLKENY